MDLPSIHHKYRGYSEGRTRTALGSYSRPIPRSIGLPWGRCVSVAPVLAAIDVRGGGADEEARAAGGRLGPDNGHDGYVD